MNKSDIHVLELLEKHTAGLHLDTLMQMTGGDSESHAALMGQRLSRLVKSKLLVWVHDPAPPKSWNRRRYFAAQHAPAVHGEASIKRAQRAPQRVVAPKLAADVPVICNVKPIICPSGKDHRFTVDKLPRSYKSQLSASDCRPWAKVFG